MPCRTPPAANAATRPPSQQGYAPGCAFQRMRCRTRAWSTLSATGATTVHNLAYAQRSVWGGGFPFATRSEFVADRGRRRGGHGSARAISARWGSRPRLAYDDVGYELVEHTRAPTLKRRIWRRLCRGVRIIHNNLSAAMAAANVTGETGTLSAQANRPLDRLREHQAALLRSSLTGDEDADL